MAEHDRIIANEHVLDDQAHDALSLNYVERVGRSTQSREKCGERLRQTQVRGPLSRLFGDRLPLGSQRALALA